MDKKSKLSIAVIARENQTALFLSTDAHIYAVQNAGQVLDAWQEINQKEINYIFMADEFLALLQSEYKIDLANHAAFISALPNSNGETVSYSQFINSLVANAAGIDLSGGKIGE
jgi:uncharacterized tellurite resistance protein B-like protein